MTDTEANIDANIAVLDTVNELNAVTVTNATAVLTLAAAQVLASSPVLGDVTNSAFTVDVTGATAAQAYSIVSELTGLSDAGHITYAIGVSDTAASIAAALNSLETEHVNSLTIGDSNPLNITYTQFQNDGTVLGKLTGTDTVNVTGVTGQAYGSFTDTYINGSVAETIENNTNGSTTAIGYANGFTFTPAGPGAHAETITVDGLPPRELRLLGIVRKCFDHGLQPRQRRDPVQQRRILQCGRCRTAYDAGERQCGRYARLGRHDHDGRGHAELVRVPLDRLDVRLRRRAKNVRKALPGSGRAFAVLGGSPREFRNFAVPVKMQWNQYDRAGRRGGGFQGYVFRARGCARKA